MDKIAVLPAIVVLGLFFYGKRPKELFLYFFLPILTVIPSYYEADVVSGVPEFSFWSTVSGELPGVLPTRYAPVIFTR